MPTLCLCLGSLAAVCVAAGGPVFAAAALPGEPYGLPRLAGMALLAALLPFLPNALRRGARDLAQPAVQAETERLRPMLIWSLAIAVSFSLMGAGMLYAGAVSARVIAAGWTVTVFAALCAVAAFIGVLLPRLYTPVIYCSLFFIWLVVPVAGMEAYMYAEGVGMRSAYAADYWKWTYVFCAAGTVAAIRLLILRQDLLRR